MKLLNRNFASVSRMASAVLLLVLTMNLLLISEARRHNIDRPIKNPYKDGVNKKYHPVPPKTWGSAKAGVNVAPSSPPDVNVRQQEINEPLLSNEATIQCGSIMQTNTKASEQQDDICSLAAAHGRGIATEVRYFFNSTSGRCEEFIYGGCGGNENRFLTIEGCDQRCNPFGCPPYCSMEYCSDRPTRTALCTLQNPEENAACTASCRITNCKICYYADEFRSLPGNCTTCNSYPNSVAEAGNKCFKQWATCTRRANGAVYGDPSASDRTQENLKCYEHPCQ